MLARIETVPLTEQQAQTAGRLFWRLKNQGKQIGPFDALIAAVALMENERRVSNDSDFARIEGLRLETY